MEDKIVGRITDPKYKEGESTETVISVSFEESESGDEVFFTAKDDVDFGLVLGKKDLQRILSLRL
jgi:hypothetical protein